MAKKPFLAAAAQVCATDHLDDNLAACRRLAAQAADAGVRLLVLPECFAFIGRHARAKFAIAERFDGDQPGPILATVMDIARTHGLWVIAGGIAETAITHPDTGEVERTHITCLTVSPTGEITATYRKIHLFDVDIPGEVVYAESDTNAPGDEIVVADTPLARIGLSVCYDLRFPEMYREMAVRRGAQVFVVPAAFTAHTGAAHWHVLLRARAIENQCFVIAAGQFGQHNPKRASYGHSLIIDPWGSVVSEHQDGEGLAIGAIALDELDRRRRNMPVLKHQTRVPQRVPAK